MYFRKYSQNQKGNDYVCADIHGCFDTLEDRLQEIKFDKKVDRLFALGDLIDRGPYNERVLDYLKKSWFNSILGNHELLCIWGEFYYKWENCWYMNGGNWIHNVPQHDYLIKLREYISTLPLIVELENHQGKSIGLVHAEVYPNQKWDDLTSKANSMFLPDLQHSGSEYAKFSLFVEQLIWSRSKIQTMKEGDPHLIVDGIDYILHGHTIVKETVQLGNCYYLDLGCYNTKQLNIININDL